MGSHTLQSGEAVVSDNVKFQVDIELVKKKEYVRTADFRLMRFGRLFSRGAKIFRLNLFSPRRHRVTENPKRISR